MKTKQRLSFENSRKLYLISMVVVLLLAAVLRLYLLEADAPFDLSPSQELNLDGPVTIAAGRDRALFGSWDPYPGPLQPYRYYPAMNWLSFLTFSIIGRGYWQANFISVAAGFLSILCVAGFAREQFGRRAAFFSALFLASNYVYVFYNRNPMAYTTVAFGLTLSLYCWGKGVKRPVWFFLSGAVMAFNTLFVKLPGFAILPAALLGFFVLWWPQRRVRSLKPYAPALLFGFGAALVALLWAAFIYLPYSRTVSQAYYVRTFSPSYTLEDNIRFAIQSLLLFGVDFGFSLRMLPLFLLSYGFMFYRVGQLLSKNRPSLKVGEIVALTYLATTVAMLFFSGIRPLRFQILLIPPMSLVAALALDAWLRTDKVPLPEKFGRFYPIYIQVGLTYFFYQFLTAVSMLINIARFRAGPVNTRVAPGIGTLYILLVWGLLLAIVAAGVFLWRVVQVKRFTIPLPGFDTRWKIVLLIGVLSVGGDLFQYGTWAKDPQFSIVEASRQIGEELSREEAILGGSYAYTLAMENELPAVWFYGHSPKESIEAAEFTHLVMEAESPLSEELTNDEKIRENFPELMGHVRIFKEYSLRNYLVRVYEIEP